MIVHRINFSSRATRKRALRFSIERFTAEAEIECALEILLRVIRKLREV